MAKKLSALSLNEAADLLRQAHAAAEKMSLPEVGQIRRIQTREGFEF